MHRAPSPVAVASAAPMMAAPLPDGWPFGVRLAPEGTSE
jgi:hypothetical protein